MKAKAVPYTMEDDVTPDPGMLGLVMLHIGEPGAIPDHVLDRIPDAAAEVICSVINGDQ